MKKNAFSTSVVVIAGAIVFGIALGDVVDPAQMPAAAKPATEQSAPTPETAANAAPSQQAQQAQQAEQAEQAESPQPASQQTKMINEEAFGNTPTARAAFTRVIRSLIPMDPNQIVTLRSLFDQSQQAVTQYPGVPPKPTSSSIMVNLSPGATPPVIRLRQGYVTSLVFLDSTGQPWPIVGYDLGDPRSFNIQPAAPDGKSNMLIIQSLVRYEQGNLAVMLKDQSTPVMLTLIPGQRAVDYRVDLRIPGVGPNALLLTEGMPSAENPVLLNFLDGTAPDGAKLLEVKGPPAQAWEYHGKLFLRTRVTILSPGWLATMSSPDGTHVYEMMATPVILASERGQMVQLSVKGL